MFAFYQRQMRKSSHTIWLDTPPLCQVLFLIPSTCRVTFSWVSLKPWQPLFPQCHTISMAGFHSRTNAILHKTRWDRHSSRWGWGGPACVPCSLPVPRCLSHALRQVLQLRKPALTTPIARFQGRLRNASCCPTQGGPLLPRNTPDITLPIPDSI